MLSEPLSQVASTSRCINPGGLGAAPELCSPSGRGGQTRVVIPGYLPRWNQTSFTLVLAMSCRFVLVILSLVAWTSSCTKAEGVGASLELHGPPVGNGQARVVRYWLQLSHYTRVLAWLWRVFLAILFPVAWNCSGMSAGGLGAVLELNSPPVCNGQARAGAGAGEGTPANPRGAATWPLADNKWPVLGPLTSWAATVVLQRFPGPQLIT